jgi:hypothetical protein
MSAPIDAERLRRRMAISARAVGKALEMSLVDLSVQRLRVARTAPDAAVLFAALLALGPSRAGKARAKHQATESPILVRSQAMEPRVAEPEESPTESVVRQPAAHRLAEPPASARAAGEPDAASPS